MSVNYVNSVEVEALITLDSGSAAGQDIERSKPGCFEWLQHHCCRGRLTISKSKLYYESFMIECC